MSSSSNGSKLVRAGLILFSVLLVMAAWLRHGPDLVARATGQPGQIRDFLQEWLAGKNLITGRPIYGPLESDTRQHAADEFAGKPWDSGLQYNAHPPAAALLGAPFAVLPYHQAFQVWNVLQVLLLLMVVAILARTYAWPVELLLFVMALLIVAYPVAAQMDQGQLNVMLLSLIVLAWQGARNGYARLAGFCLALAGAWKLFPLVLLLPFLVRGQTRVVLTAGLTFISLHLMILLLQGVTPFLVFVREVMPELTVFQSNWENISLQGVWLRLFHPHPANGIEPILTSKSLAQATLWLGRATIALTYLRQCVQSRQDQTHDACFCSGTLAMMLLSPVTWPHSWVMAIFALVILARRLTSLGEIVLFGLCVWFILLPNVDLLVRFLGWDRVHAVIERHAGQLTIVEHLLLASGTLVLLLLYGLSLWERRNAVPV
jgi:hypothetical protein